MLNSVKKNVRGNESANLAAKSTLDLPPPPVKFKILYTDLKPRIIKFLHAKCNNALITTHTISFSWSKPL